MIRDVPAEVKDDAIKHVVILAAQAVSSRTVDIRISRIKDRADVVVFVVFSDVTGAAWFLNAYRFRFVFHPFSDRCPYLSYTICDMKSFNKSRCLGIAIYVRPVSPEDGGIASHMIMYQHFLRFGDVFQIWNNSGPEGRPRETVIVFYDAVSAYRAWSRNGRGSEIVLCGTLQTVDVHIPHWFCRGVSPPMSRVQVVNRWYRSKVPPSIFFDDDAVDYADADDDDDQENKSGVPDPEQCKASYVVPDDDLLVYNLVDTLLQNRRRKC